MKIKFFINSCIIYILLFNQVFASILFSEIFPNTEDDTTMEYIELYNSGDYEISLGGFILKDKIGKEYIFSDEEILGAGEKKKYNRTETKIILNNTDEELFLYDDLGNLVDSFSYNTSIKGEKIIILEISEEEIVEEEIVEEEIIEEEIIDEEIIEEEIIDEEIIEEEIIEEEIIDEEIIEEEIIDNFEAPEIVFTFQSPTYLLEKDIISTVYNCNSNYELCKINLDLRNSFIGDFKENDFECEIDFGFSNAEENKCNPASIIVPLGTYDFKIRIISKKAPCLSGIQLDKGENNCVFSEESFRVINNGYIKPVTNNTSSSYSSTINIINTPINITKPIIEIQSGLNEKNECMNKNNCSLNLKYIEQSKYERCLWEFPGGTFETGTNTKCNPGYVKYGTGEFNVKLRVFEESNYYNYKESELVFRNEEVLKEEDVEDQEEQSNLIESPHPNPHPRGEGIIGVEIFKVMPNPVGSDNFEYIELVNNTDEIINLKGCSLDDELDGGSKEFIFKNDELIGAGEVKKYKKELTKLNLNNDSDEVNLICNNELIDVLKWDFEIKSGYSLDHSKLDISSGEATVIDVIDGDTIKIQFTDSTKIETLRLIGVDTPETKHKNKEIEKYGKEAYEYVLKELKGKEIKVELDSDNLRDIYSRLLGFVYLDQESFNKKLIELGYSKAYLDYDFKYKTDYIKAEKVAKEAEIGIWASSAITLSEMTSPQPSPSEERGQGQLESIIDIQGKIGKNKILKGNTLTCYDTCSINFDGSESTGNIKKYSWDFGNGKTFEGKNPGYAKYEKLGNYKVYLAVISDTGELDISEFYVNFIKTPKKLKVSVIKSANAEDDSELESDEIISNEELKDDGFNYSLLLYIIIGICGSVLLFVILRREKLV